MKHTLPRLALIIALLPAIASADVPIDKITAVVTKDRVEVAPALVFKSTTIGSITGSDVALFNDAGTMKFKTSGGTVTIGSGGASTGTSTSILGGNGSGGFSDITIGSGLSYNSGTHTLIVGDLSATYTTRANNLSDLADVSAAQSNLGLEIGNDVQAHSANLDTYATLTPGAAGQNLIVATTEAAGRLAISAQQSNAKLTAIAGLANSVGWLYNNGSGPTGYTTPTKSDVGLGSVENTALSTWAGSTNITTLGTIATGTWHGTAIASAYLTGDDTAYDATSWNGATGVPTKNAIRDKIESLGSGSGDMLKSTYDPMNAGYISGAPSAPNFGGQLKMDASAAGDGGSIYTYAGPDTQGGSIFTYGGGVSGSGSGGSGGTINTSGAGYAGGSILTYGLDYARGGDIWMFAGFNGLDNGGAGGSLYTYGGTTTVATGGLIDTHGDTAAGGSINTSNGGGSIDTTAGGDLTMGTGNLAGGNVTGTILTTAGSGASLAGVVHTADTGTVTNTMLAGSIANAKLTNSAITIAGTSTSLGGSITLDTIEGLASDGLIQRSGANTRVIATAGTHYLSPTQANGLASGRLTLSSGVPVLTSSVTGSGTVYFTPHKGNVIALYTGSAWKVMTFSELSITLSSLSSSTAYDVFAYDNSGTVALDTTAWTNATTRATALTTQDGVMVKTGATTRRYLGSFITDGSKQCSVTFGTIGTAGQGQCDIWNNNNQIGIDMTCGDSADSWSYATTSFRAYDGGNGASGANNRVTLFIGNLGSPICALFTGASSGATNTRAVGIGIDSVTTNSAIGGYMASIVNLIESVARVNKVDLLGQHYIQALEKGNTSITFYGDNGAGATVQSGLTVSWTY